MTRPARALIDADAARWNLDLVRRATPGRRILAIVKADGYGHGVARMARALTAADAFGVASVEEAIRIRAADVRQPIVLLDGPFEAAEIPEIVAHGLETVVHNDEQIAMLAAVPEPIPAWIKIDTGMHRLGFAPHELGRVFEALARPDRVIRYMTHFASAHIPGDPSIERQLAAFRVAMEGRRGEICVANSSAILNRPDAHGDWVRPGIMLYGVSPFADSSGADLGLKPVLTCTSALIAVKRVAAGGGVGYGQAFRCPGDMPIGVVAFGYGDGYPRHAGTGTPVLVNGVRTQVLGHASMDMLTVDLRPVPEARVGDPVTLWGPALPVEDVARSAGTIPYELLCRMRMRAQFVETQG
ncbi:MAG: alanine racemase [Gammaproteobacteria bacterium]|nr:alanine racemase [Gammaproteobacteria bacterium]MBI5617669.1 alanine racemase [Gammaproteobacteria bacterium]